MSLSRTSILFSRARQVGMRYKSQFQYETDKTFAQRWIAKQTARQQQLQQFWKSEEVPLWWKSTGDRIVVTATVAAVVASFIISVNKLLKFTAGEL